MIVDGASIYKSKSTLASLKKRPRIVLVPLPNYAPKLKLQEQVWRWLRAVVTHNHYFGSLDAAIAAAKRFFAKLIEQPEAVLRLIGLTGPPLLAGARRLYVSYVRKSGSPAANQGPTKVISTVTVLPSTSTKPAPNCPRLVAGWSVVKLR